MEQFSKETIAKIEDNLRLHINYKGVSSGGKFLIEMDRLTYNYSGARGLALSNMLNDYFKQVGVKNLDEALNRLREQPCTLHSVSGSIVVTEQKNNPNQRKITSNSNWFDCDYILFNVKDDYISITRPDLDYRGKAHKPTKQNNRFHFLVTAEIPFGKFEFDVNDSTEDELVIYYR